MNKCGKYNFFGLYIGMYNDVRCGILIKNIDNVYLVKVNRKK